MKCREFLSKSEEDELSFALAQMLIDSLNMKLEDFVSSPSAK